MLRPYTCTNTLAAKQHVRIPDLWFAEDAAPAVAGALRLGARGGFEVVDELPHDPALHQSCRALGHALVIDGAGRGPARRHGLGDLLQSWGVQRFSLFSPGGSSSLPAVSFPKA